MFTKIKLGRVVIELFDQHEDKLCYTFFIHNLDFKLMNEALKGHFHKFKIFSLHQFYLTPLKRVTIFVLNFI